MSLSLTEALAASVAATDACWRAGDLLYKLGDDATQLKLYDNIKRQPGKKFVTEGARKLGKSYLHGVIALETALQNPGKQINWVTATNKQCRQTLLPILEEISADAPDDCRGHFSSLDGRWLMPNGAFIQLVGAETKQDCEKSRGPSCVLIILDEAGFIDLLEYLIDSVLKPQMRRIRRQVGSFVGLVLSVSTTPYTPTHYFCRMADLADTEGAYQRLTIYDSGWETPGEIEAYVASEAREKGLSVEAFEKTSTFRREYLSIRVIDEEAVVFIEFHDADLRKRIVVPHERPMGFAGFIQKRVSIDLGMADKTGLLFGYVDFLAAKVVIEAERLLDRPSTQRIASCIRETEAQLWPGADPLRTSRAVDDPHGRVVLDLWELEKIRTDKAVKHDREASIGIIRTMLPAERLLISPECVQLQRQLLEATRSKNKKDFARDEADTGNSHFDLCAALMYFVRGLSLTHNPYPHDFDALSGGRMPAEHPLVARRAALGVEQHRGLRGALLGGNKFVNRGR